MRKAWLGVGLAVIVVGCGKGDSTVTQAGGWEKPKAPVVNNVETLPSGTVIHRDPGGDK